MAGKIAGLVTGKDATYDIDPRGEHHHAMKSLVGKHALRPILGFSNGDLFFLDLLFQTGAFNGIVFFYFSKSQFVHFDLMKPNYNTTKRQPAQYPTKRYENTKGQSSIMNQQGSSGGPKHREEVNATRPNVSPFKSRNQPDNHAIQTRESNQVIKGDMKEIEFPNARILGV